MSHDGLELSQVWGSPPSLLCSPHPRVHSRGPSGDAASPPPPSWHPSPGLRLHLLPSLTGGNSRQAKQGQPPGSRRLTSFRCSQPGHSRSSNTALIAEAWPGLASMLWCGEVWYSVVGLVLSDTGNQVPAGTQQAPLFSPPKPPRSLSAQKVGRRARGLEAKCTWLI